MTTYSADQPNTNDPQTAKDIVLQALLPLGFEIMGDSAFSLSVRKPGYTSTRQSALLGISHAEFEFSRSMITVRAELGGVDRLARLLLMIVLGVAVFDSAIFIGLWYFIEKLHENLWFLFIPALTMIPWIFIGPMIVRSLGKGCQSAIDRLLYNASGEYRH